MQITESMLRSLIRQTLLTEEVFGKMAFVYTGTVTPPEKFISLLEKDEIKPGMGSGSLYGKALYTVYELENTKTSSGDYGNYIYKLAVNFDGFISFDQDVTVRVYGRPITPAEQAGILGLPKSVVKKLEEFHTKGYSEFSSDEAYKASKVLVGIVKGLIFTGRNDGKVAVIYDASTVTPVAYRQFDEKSWTKVGKQELQHFTGRVSEPFEREKYEQNPELGLDRVTSFLKRYEKLGPKGIPPEKRVIRGNADLTSMMLSDLPVEGLHVMGNLYPSYNMTSLPKDLRVDGHLDASQSQIDSIPSGLYVGKNLTLPPAMRRADFGFRVGGDLNAQNTRLSEIPPGTTVRGNVDLTDSKISKLPDNFTVGGDLIISTSKIRQLPSGLRVGGNLDLRYTVVYQLPSDLEVGDRIYMDELDRSTIPPHMKGVGDKQGMRKIWVGN